MWVYKLVPSIVIIVMLFMFAPVWLIAFGIIAIGFYHALAFGPQGDYDFFTPMVGLGILVAGTMISIGIIIGYYFL